MQDQGVAVIGGGIIGVCCASYLLKEGFDVTIIERDEIAAHASAVNGGGIADVSITPFAMPEVWRRVPDMVLNPKASTTVRWTHIPRMLPWSLRFLRASSAGQVAYISRTRAELLSHTHEAYAPLIAEAGAQDLVSDCGWLFVYETDQALKASMRSHDLCRSHGIALQIIGPGEVRELEPDISPAVKHGVFMPGARRTTSPLRFTRRLAEAFARNGGKIVRATVQDYGSGNGSGVVLKTDAGDMTFDKVVLSAGAWSKRLGRRFGLRLPIEAVRGYALMVDKPNIRVSAMVASSERQVGCGTMDDGRLRVGCMAEIDDVDSPPDFKRAEQFLTAAKALFPKLEGGVASSAIGARPATPDSLPIIDRSPRDANVYIATGHGHTGMSMGGVTGKLLAELMTGRPTTVPLEPFSVRRFM